MKKKQFKAQSKKLLNLMINSIYTNKDIFLRELISNASDAMDKLYFTSLTDTSLKVDRKKLEINLNIDKNKKTITISDNGSGMNQEELENNLGTIAESDSNLFKKENKNKDISIIGQFGVGFYSVFMISKKVEVYSKKYDSDKSYLWTSTGEDGYSIETTTKDSIGTNIVITLKDDDEDYKYSKYLEENTISELVKKYSNYIHYPIKMEVTHKHLKKDSKDEYEDVKEIETLNNMTPLWKKDSKKIKEEEYNNFYTSTYYDYENPMDVINYKVEGNCSFTSLLFIPSHAPYDLYAKEYKRGLQLYSNGVLIMDKCEDLLPDYYSFVKGLVDSEDLSLNISREILQQDKQLTIISKNIKKKITKYLEETLKNDREKYEKFFKEFGLQLKIGIYNSYGMAKDELQDLLLFYSSKDKKLVTLKEYRESMQDKQESIYYAVGESIDKIDLMPQVEEVKDKDFSILYLTDYADEFVMQVLQSYDGKDFKNVANADLNLENEEEKKAIDKVNTDNEKLLDIIKNSLGDKVSKVKFTSSLKKHPVCLTTEGNISTGMEKVLNAIPNEQNVKASTVLSINTNHPIATKIKELYKKDPKEVENYAKILYAQARLIEGLPIDNPNEFSDLVCDIIAK